MAPLAALTRRFRVGRPIVVVSGLPRSGTSLAMGMLDVGGFPVLTDGIRQPDASNPNGYYEFERVKMLERHRDVRWLGQARGKAVKIVSLLLTWLPEDYDYRVVFMERQLEEILLSQTAMLRQRVGAPADDMREARVVYAEHLRQVDRFLARRSCFSVLRVGYGEVVANPGAAATRLAAFVGEKLDLARMAALVDPALHRNRHDGAPDR